MSGEGTARTSTTLTTGPRAATTAAAASSRRGGETRAGGPLLTQAATGSTARPGCSAALEAILYFYAAGALITHLVADAHVTLVSRPVALTVMRRWSPVLSQTALARVAPTASGYSAMVMSQDQPVSYLTLRRGTPVETRDGARIGVVAHVLADPDADIFDGLVIDQGSGHHRFADADLVAAMDEQAVRLNLDARAADALPEPTDNPASMSTGPDDMVPDDVGDKLRRAWQLISGAG